MKNNPNQNSDEYFNITLEEEVDEQYLRNFIEDLLRDENFQPENIAKLKNRKAASLIETLPKKLRDYLKELQALEKESAKARDKDSEGQDLNSNNPKTKKEVEAEKQRRDRVKAIAKEIFIISCASSKPLEKSMEFFDKCQLKPEDLSKFGECGLSPLTAAMLSGKIEKMQGLIDRGANVNEKNSYGFTARDFAEMIGEQKAVEVLKANGAKGINSEQQENDQERSRQKEEEEKARKKAKNDDSKERKAESAALKRQQAEIDRMQQEQLRIYREMEAIYEYTLAKEKLAKESAQKEQKTRDAEQKSSNLQSQSQTAQEVTTYSTKERESSNRQELSEALAKIAQQSQIQNTEKAENSQPSKVAEKPQPEIKNDKEQKQTKSAAIAELEKMLQIDLSKEDINKLLFNAVKSGQSLIAVLLINCGANVNHREGSKTIIDIAVDNADSTMIGALSMFSRREVLVSAISQAIAKGNYITQDLRDSVVGQDSKKIDLESEKRSPIRDLKTSSQSFEAKLDQVFELGGDSKKLQKSEVKTQENTEPKTLPQFVEKAVQVESTKEQKAEVKTQQNTESKTFPSTFEKPLQVDLKKEQLIEPKFSVSEKATTENKTLVEQSKQKVPDNSSDKKIESSSVLFDSKSKTDVAPTKPIQQQKQVRISQEKEQKVLPKFEGLEIGYLMAEEEKKSKEKLSNIQSENLQQKSQIQASEVMKSHKENEISKNQQSADQGKTEFETKKIEIPSRSPQPLKIQTISGEKVFERKNHKADFREKVQSQEADSAKNTKGKNL